MSTGVVALMVRFTLRPESVAAFDGLVAETLQQISVLEPGTLVYASHSVQGQPLQRIFYEVYSDAAAFAAHEEQPYVRHFLEQRGQHLSAAVEVDFLTPRASKGLPLITPTPVAAAGQSPASAASSSRTGPHQSQAGRRQ